jgi:hypothetical protein
MSATPTSAGVSSGHVEVWKTPSSTPLLPRAFQDAIYERGDYTRYARMEAFVSTNPTLFANTLQRVAPLVHTAASRVGPGAGEGSFVNAGSFVPSGTLLPPHVTVKVNDAAALPAPRVNFLIRSVTGGARFVGGLQFDWQGTMDDMHAYNRESRRRANVSSLWTEGGSVYISRTLRRVDAGEELLRSYGAAHWYYRTLKYFLFATTRMSDFDPSLRFASPEEDVRAHRTMILVCWLMVWIALHSSDPADPDVDRWQELYCLWISELGLNSKLHHVSAE